jgi:hypothetical protein
MKRETFQPGDRVTVRPPRDARTGRTCEPWAGTVRDVLPGALWVVRDRDPSPALQGRAAYNVHPAWVEALP